MEWLGVFLWVLALGLALPLAAGGSLTSPSLGLQPLFVTGGLVLCVLYLALDAYGDRWMAWASGGLALAGAAAVGAGTARLVSDDRRTSGAGESAEESAAMLAGLELPLLLTLAFVMGLAAAGITTVGPALG
jgi:hypothetical protein